ncbi:PEP-CTERM sorting domain-containing protein [Methylophilus luteus]|uniref:PEP-CTERM sorting domain-containing protein n=1 Tax=Methylophilus luteus TaxID=640108 RepID=A0ABW3F6H7_9PROT
MSGIFKNLGVVLVTAFSFEASAQAASTTVDLQSLDSGTYSSVNAGHISSETSIYIQQDSANVSRNFFVFDFNGLNMTNLVSAELYANNVWNLSPESHLAYSLYDVTTNINDLRTSGTGQYSVFNDLGTGARFANIELNNPGRYDNFVMTFNQSGIDAAKAATGLFAFGGALTSQTSGVAFMFGDNENPGAPFTYGLRLTFSESVTAVPEADSYAMLLAGLGVVSLIIRRRNK